MTVNQLTIFIFFLALEPLADGEERCRVPYEWSINGFGLNLAIFELMLKVSVLKMGHDAPVMCMDMPLKEGVGQQEKNGEENKSTGVGNTLLVGDVLP